MRIIEFIYISTTLCSVLAALPQLKQIWKMKNADEFNLLSWAAWALAQMTALFYALFIHSLPYLIVNIMWLTFYGTMIGLILKYRHGKAVPVAVNNDGTENDA
jgi:uncharacterized protein with PQ loop repeat